jgi:hypothetical protein
MSRCFIIVLIYHRYKVLDLILQSFVRRVIISSYKVSVLLSDCKVVVFWTVQFRQMMVCIVFLHFSAKNRHLNVPLFEFYGSTQNSNFR